MPPSLEVCFYIGSKVTDDVTIHPRTSLNCKTRTKVKCLNRTYCFGLSTITRGNSYEKLGLCAISKPVSCLALPRTVMGYQSEFSRQHPRPTSSASRQLSSVLLPKPPHVLYLRQHSMLKSGCRASGSTAQGRVRMASMEKCRRMGMVALLSWALLFSSVVIAAEEDQPKDFEYYQIWASQDGETHFAECKMKGFNFTAYSSLPQYVRSDFGGAPIEVVLTELPVGLAQPLHSPPQVQFVATLYGSWYIETTDGTRHNFKKGQLLFQDNTAKSPADKQPMHYSGTHGNKPCQQLVVQLSRPPQVDNPCPF